MNRIRIFVLARCFTFTWSVVFGFWLFVGESAPTAYVDTDRFESEIVAFETEDAEVAPPEGAVVLVGTTAINWVAVAISNKGGTVFVGRGVADGASVGGMLVAVGIAA